MDEQLSAHFKRSEFACKDGCGFSSPTPALVAGLEQLREAIGRPVIIDDACRCAKHNASVGGCQHSQHELGAAADIRVAGMTARELYAAAARVSAFRGFGVSEGSYIHVDVREAPARWCYDARGREIAWVDSPAEERAA